MGCIHPGTFSTQSVNGPISSSMRMPDGMADSPNVFYVRNLDEESTDVSEGYLELGPEGLELRQARKEPLSWPHRCLRRYGFNGDLFSFESGRQCSTGTGIFAFRCTRAEQLYKGLDDHIRRITGGGTTTTTTMGSAISNGAPANGVSVSTGIPVANGLRPANGLRNGVTPRGAARSLRPVMPRYDPGLHPEVADNYLTPTSSASVVLQENSSPVSAGPVYMNGSLGLPNVAEEEGEDSHIHYINTGAVKSDGSPTEPNGHVLNGSSKVAENNNTPVVVPNANGITRNSGAANEQRVFTFPPPVSTNGLSRRHGPLPPVGPSAAIHQRQARPPSHQPQQLLYAQLDLSDSNKGSVGSGSVSSPPGGDQPYTDIRKSASSSDDDLFTAQAGTNCYTNVSPPTPAAAKPTNGLIRVNYQSDTHILPAVAALNANHEPDDSHQSYTEIDFPKTEALNKKTADNHGGRQTRHDSTAEV